MVDKGNPLGDVGKLMEEMTKGLKEKMAGLEGVLPASQIIKTKVCTGVKVTQRKFLFWSIDVYAPEYANVTAYKQANGHVALDFENPADADKFVK